VILHGIKKLPLLLGSSLTVFGFLIFTSQGAQSQTNRLNHVLAQNFEPIGQGIKINTPTNWKSQNILIGWQTQSGQQYSEQVLLTNGKNIIIPKQGWDEPIRVLATNIQGLQSEIISLNFSYKFSAFLKSNPISPGSINFDLGYTFGNIKFSIILYALLLISALLSIVLVKKSCTKALSIGLVVAFFFLNLRQIKNQIDVIQNFNINQKQIPPFEDLESFFDNCQTTVGPSSWSIEKLPGVWNSYAKYSMAANPYLPKPKSQKSKATYLITNKNPKNANIVRQARGIKLIKQNQ